MSVINASERFLSPKELSLEFERYGLGGFGPKHCRLLVAAIRRDWGVGSGIVRGTHIRLSVAYGWLLTHPHWQPFSAGRTGPQRGAGQGRAA